MVSPLRTGPKPPSEPKPKAKAARPKRRAAKPKAETLPAVVPTGPMAGFDQFSVEDYAQPVAGKEGRYLTVSPLRAIMAEELSRNGEHVVTERTKQGVLFGTGLGMDSRTMAILYGLETDEFERLYAREIATSTPLMLSDITANLYNIARDPQHTSSVKAGVYLLGKLGNKVYKDAQRSEIAVNPQTRTIDPSLLDDDQRQALKDILVSALRLAQPNGVIVEGTYADVDDEDDAEDLI